MAETKLALRREMLARRAGLPPESSEAAGARVAELLALSPEFAAARCIVMYEALEFEVSTARVIAVALAAGKELLWPRVVDPRQIEVAACQQRDAFVRDAVGVFAPPPEVRACRIQPEDLVLVPGVAFTRRGDRLGRGGGHYDRLLADASEARSVGVAFDIQLVDEVPMESHDRAVDMVATPSGMWRRTR